MKLALIAVLWSAIAAADPPRFVLAVNSPPSWALSEYPGGPSLAKAASAYVGFGRHQALRLNVASYEVDPYATLAVNAFFGLIQADLACSRSGHADDVGAGWMYFLRERWKGPSIEVGVLGRRRSVYDCGTDNGIDITDMTTTSTTLAVRALVGSNILAWGHVYLSVAAGGSAGYEWGAQVDDGARSTTMSRVHRADFEPELFGRVGWAFL